MRDLPSGFVERTYSPWSPKKNKNKTEHPKYVDWHHRLKRGTTNKSRAKNIISSKFQQNEEGKWAATLEKLCRSHLSQASHRMSWLFSAPPTALSSTCHRKPDQGQSPNQSPWSHLDLSMRHEQPYGQPFLLLVVKKQSLQMKEESGGISHEGSMFSQKEGKSLIQYLIITNMDL